MTLFSQQDKKKEEKTDEISLEELIEEKRAEMSRKDNLTKVTLQTFVAWKKRKIREKIEAEKKDKEKKKEKYMAGAKVGMSGREMFMFDPKMIQDEVRLFSACYVFLLAISSVLSQVLCFLLEGIFFPLPKSVLK